MGVKATIKGRMEGDIPYIILLKEKSKKQDKTLHENRIFENKTLLVGKYPILNKEKHRSIYWVSHSSALTRQSQ